MAESLIEEIPAALTKALSANLSVGEQVQLRLKGAFKEALVCTDRRLLIVKSGLMTGQMFGSDVFQLPYSGITSVEVKYRVLSGYFEVGAGGMQNTAKSYWSSDANTDPAKAPNCVALNSKQQADTFRKACAWIMVRIDEARRGPAPTIAPQAAPQPAARDIASEIERLWALKTSGALSQAEFDAMKAQILRG